MLFIKARSTLQDWCLFYYMLSFLWQIFVLFCGGRDGTIRIKLDVTLERLQA